MAAIAVCVGWGDGLAVQLSQQDVGDGVMHGLGSVLEQVGETDVETSLAQTNGCIQRSKTAEADFEWGNGGTWPESAVLLLKDGHKLGRHGSFRLTPRA